MADSFQEEVLMGNELYGRVDPTRESSSHAKLISLCEENKRVIDFGCWTGLVSKELKKNGCYVLGIELDADAAEKAEAVCDRVVVADIEDLDLTTALGGERYDVGLFGDVIEHLKDPWGILVQMRELLSPGGYILVSVPNIAHVSIRLKLLLGEFDYMDTGILDEMHLRFFTRKSIVELLECCGYYVDTIDWTETAISRNDIESALNPLGLANMEEVLKAFASWEAVAFQYVLKAFPASEARQVQRLSREKVDAERKLAKLQEENAGLTAIADQTQQVLEENKRVSEYVLKLKEELASKAEYVAELEEEALKLRSENELGKASIADILVRLEALENRVNNG